MQRTLDQELVGEAGKAVNGAAQAPAAADPLDAFMSDVAVQLEQSKVRRPWLGMAPVILGGGPELDPWFGERA